VLIAGGLLILVALGALAYAQHAKRSARKLTATETLTCGDIDTLAKGVAGEVGGGSFSQRCEVVGKAQAGASGVLKAPESGADAVWHRTTVTRHWEERRQVQRNGKTVTEWASQSDTISELSSSAPFAVSDGSGSVVVAPEGADVDHPERVVDRSEAEEAGSVAAAVVDAFIDLDGRRNQRLETEEWIIRPGARVYVHGEVSDSTGALTFAKPPEGRFLISTRTEQDIVKGQLSGAKWATIGGIAAAVLGVVLLVAGAAS
jgi:hypothetical protein